MSRYDIIVILEVVDISGESVRIFLDALNKWALVTITLTTSHTRMCAVTVTTNPVCPVGCFRFDSNHHYTLKISSRLGRNAYKEQFMFLYRWASTCTRRRASQHMERPLPYHWQSTEGSWKVIFLSSCFVWAVIKGLLRSIKVLLKPAWSTLLPVSHDITSSCSCRFKSQCSAQFSQGTQSTLFGTSTCWRFCSQMLNHCWFFGILWCALLMQTSLRHTTVCLLAALECSLRTFFSDCLSCVRP